MTRNHVEAVLLAIIGKRVSRIINVQDLISDKCTNSGPYLYDISTRE